MGLDAAGAARLNEQQLVLQTIGDLELNRRFLLARVAELEAQLALAQAAQPDEQKSDS